MNFRTRITEESSRKVANVGLLGAFLVVSIHVLGTGGGAWRPFFDMIADGVALTAVPMFFLFSGYFIARHVNEPGWWRREVGKRVGTLLVPMFAWTTIIVLVGLPLSLYSDFKSGRPLGSSVCFLNCNPWDVYGLRLWCCPMVVPMWFLRALFLLVLTSGVSAWLVKRMGACFVVVLFLICIWFRSCAGMCAIRGLDVWWQCLFRFGYSLDGLFYFSVGMLICLKGLTRVNGKIAFTCLLVGMLLEIVRIRVDSVVLVWTLPMIIVPCLMYVIWYWVPPVELPRCLRAMSFPVYMMHPIMIFFMGVFCRQLGVAMDSWYCMLFAWVFVFAGSIIVANIIRKSSPTAFCFLFGGREA